MFSITDSKADGEAVANGKLANVEESGKKERSVLQAKLTRLAIQIGYAGSFVAGCTVLILVIRFCISNYAIKSKSFSVADFQVSLCLNPLEYFFLAIYQLPDHWSDCVSRGCA